MLIEVYGASWCAPCQQVKNELARRKVVYTFYDVDDSVNLRKLSEITTGRTVPVVVVDGEIVSGLKSLCDLLDGVK